MLGTGAPEAPEEAWFHRRKETLFYLSCSLKEIVGSKAEPGFVGKRSFLITDVIR